MIARLKLKGIDGRAPPGVTNMALLLRIELDQTPNDQSNTQLVVICQIIARRSNCGEDSLIVVLTSFMGYNSAIGINSQELHIFRD